VSYTLYFDFETRSEIDLKKVGAVKYSLHPSTEVVCAAFKIDNSPTKSWSPLLGEHTPSAFCCAVYNPNVELCAHNVMFDYLILKNVLGIGVNIRRLNCTAARSAAMGLPRSLEGAAQALGLDVQKDVKGKRLMLKYCKPRSAWAKQKSLKAEPKTHKYFNSTEEINQIISYCETDVDVLYSLDQRLPPLSLQEKEIWLSNLKMNIRGVQTNIPLAQKIVSLYEAEFEDLKKQVFDLTYGEVSSPLQTLALTKWINGQGVDLKSLAIGEVKAALKSDLPSDVKEVLEVRVKASKSSIKKYKAILTRTCARGRVGDLTLYHGASTGRDSGRGVQIQNLPRGSIKDIDSAIKIISETKDYKDLEIIYPSTSDVYSSLIRSVFRASPGSTIVAADFNAIECRILNWLSGNQMMLDAFRSDKDPYKIMASLIFNKPIDQITDDERFLGKTTVLGAGYGMGVVKFYETCLAFGVPNITPELAEKAIKIFRQKNEAITKFWQDTESAAVKAITLKKKIAHLRVTWAFDGRDLYAILPSGRRLNFPFAVIKNIPTPWGELGNKIYYKKVDSLTKKWVEHGTYGGSLVESLCQATARDITMNAIKNIEAAGYNYLFQVHDEVVAESTSVNESQFVEAILKKQPWFEDLPLKAGVWSGEYYRK
jgi:DNA polymerase